MSAIQVSHLRQDIVQLTLDMPGKSANVLTDKVLQELEQAIVELESNPPSGLVFVSAKRSTFIVGADLHAIAATLDWPPDRIERFCRRGQQLFERISRLPSVSVAAIHGACVGGGLELTLWCDARIVSDDKSTLLGLPEVRLGLIPGWGGTARLPRLIGLSTAAELITTARLVSPEEAESLGLACMVTSREHLLARATGLIDDLQVNQQFMAQRERLQRGVQDLPNDMLVFAEELRSVIDSSETIHPVAPRVVAQHMLETAGSDLSQACQSEAVAMTKVYGSEENAGLLNHFFLEERVKRVRPEYGGQAPAKLDTIGIVGCGLMGRQIAAAAARASMRCLVHDQDQSKADGLAGDLSSVGGEVQACRELVELSTCDLVIESVVENLGVKKQIFGELEAALNPQTLLASNTSAIPIHWIGEQMNHPQRLCGMHFCCPVEPLRLVEIVQAEKTSDFAVAAAVDFVKRVRKSPLLVPDTAGFVVNRLFCPTFDEAMSLLRSGLSPHQIDAPFREFGFPVGPLEMIDFIGLDTILYAGATLQKTVPHCITMSPLLPALVGRRRLGRKCGRGFYRYAEAGAAPQEDPEVYPVLEMYQGTPWQPKDNFQIVVRLLLPMIAEALQMLTEHPSLDARDIDTCSIIGMTFPAFRGGLLFWAERAQLASRAAGLEQLRPQLNAIPEWKDFLRGDRESVYSGSNSQLTDAR